MPATPQLPAVLLSSAVAPGSSTDTLYRVPALIADAGEPAAWRLDPASCVLLIAIRWWVTDFRERDDSLARLCQALDAAGAHDAAFSADQLMADVVRLLNGQ